MSNYNINMMNTMAAGDAIINTLTQFDLVMNYTNVQEFMFGLCEEAKVSIIYGAVRRLMKRGYDWSEIKSKLYTYGIHVYYEYSFEREACRYYKNAYELELLAGLIEPGTESELEYTPPPTPPEPRKRKSKPKPEIELVPEPETAKPMPVPRKSIISKIIHFYQVKIRRRGSEEAKNVRDQ
jgi:hypothetical protein